MFLKPALVQLSAALLFLAGFSFSAADTILLKSGEEIEGTIEEETPDYIVVSVQVTKSIRDKKTVQRADIKQIIKLLPDEIAFQGLKGSANVGDLKPVSAYDTAINSLKAFTSKFPDSTYNDEVAKMVASLEEERKKVSEGNVKLDGEWITPETIAADPYNHGARVLAAQMQAKLKEQDYTGALSDFEKLQMQYDESKGYANSIDTAKKALDNVDAQLAQLKKESAFKVEKRKTDLAAMPADQRVNTENAFKRQMEIYERQRAEAKEAGQVWLPTSVWDPESIDEAIETAATKRESITALDSAAEMKRAALVEQVILAANKQNWAVAEVQARLAEEAGADSEKFKEISEAVSEGKANAETIAKEKAAAAEKERLEQVRIQHEKEMAEKKAAQEKEAEEVKMAEEEAAKAAAAEKAAEGADKSEGEVNDDTNEEAAGEKKGGGLPLPLIIGLIAIMAVVSVFMIKKNKAREAEDLESLSRTEGEDEG